MEPRIGVALVMSGYLLGCYIMDQAHTLSTKAKKHNTASVDRLTANRQFFFNQMSNNTSFEVKSFFKRFSDPKVAAMRLIMSAEGTPEERDAIRAALASWYTKNL